MLRACRGFYAVGRPVSAACFPAEALQALQANARQPAQLADLLPTLRSLDDSGRQAADPGPMFKTAF